MNRREAIIAGVTGITAAVATASAADAESSQEANPDLDQIRALLKAHDQAFTNQDLNGVLACFTRKAAIMGSGPRGNLVRARRDQGGLSALFRRVR